METEQKKNMIKQALTQEVSEAITNIVPFLEDKDQEVVLSAIDALGELPPNERIERILITLTSNQSELIRYSALEALWGYNGEDVFQAFVDRLKDSNEIVRISAVEALSNLRDIEAGKFLLEALLDEEEIVRREAAIGLGKLEDSSLAPLLQEYLQQEKSNTARVGFYIGLYLLGSKLHLNPLLNLLKDSSYQVRCAVANSVLDLVDQENRRVIEKYLIEALKKEQTFAARSTLQNVLDELSSSNEIK